LEQRRSRVKRAAAISLTPAGIAKMVWNPLDVQPDRAGCAAPQYLLGDTVSVYVRSDLHLDLLHDRSIGRERLADLE
jgi:hypothetical protein